MMLFVGLFGIVVLALPFWPWKGGRMRAVPRQKFRGRLSVARA
jgi:hypothetical protein